MTETKFEGSYVPEKKYPDGSKGNYYCVCTLCGGRFVGHKRDFICPRPHKESVDE